MRPRGTWLVVVVSRQVLQIPPTACMKYSALAPRNTIRFRDKYECSRERNKPKKLLCWLDDDSEELWKWFVVQWPKNLIAAELVSVYQTTYFTLQCSLSGIVIVEMGETDNLFYFTLLQENKILNTKSYPSYYTAHISWAMPSLPSCNVWCFYFSCKCISPDLGIVFLQFGLRCISCGVLAARVADWYEDASLQCRDGRRAPPRENLFN